MTELAGRTAGEREKYLNFPRTAVANHIIVRATVYVNVGGACWKSGWKTTAATNQKRARSICTANQRPSLGTVFAGRIAGWEP